jgi:hypothetical protein
MVLCWDCVPRNDAACGMYFAGSTYHQNSYRSALHHCYGVRVPPLSFSHKLLTSTHLMHARSHVAAAGEGAPQTKVSHPPGPRIHVF